MKRYATFRKYGAKKAAKRVKPKTKRRRTTGGKRYRRRTATKSTRPTRRVISAKPNARSSGASISLTKRRPRPTFKPTVNMLFNSMFPILNRIDRYDFSRQWERGRKNIFELGLGMPPQIMRFLVMTYMTGPQYATNDYYGYNNGVGTQQKGTLFLKQKFPNPTPDPNNGVTMHTQTERYVPNPNSSTFAYVQSQKYEFEITNPENIGIEVTCYVYQPKRYLYGTDTTILNHWQEDLRNMGPINDGEHYQTKHRLDITTTAEGTDSNGWPLVPDNGDFGQFPAQTVSNTTEASYCTDIYPTDKQNYFLKSSYRVKTITTKILAPGESCRMTVSIPGYKFIPQNLLRELKLRKMDDFLTSAAYELDSMQNPAFDPESINTLADLPISWPKGRIVLFTAKSQNTFQTVAADVNSTIQNKRLIDNSGGCVEGSGSYFVNLRTKIVVRQLPVQQIDNTLYRDHRNWQLNYENMNVEAAINVENDQMVDVTNNINNTDNTLEDEPDNYLAI